MNKYIVFNKVHTRFENDFVIAENFMGGLEVFIKPTPYKEYLTDIYKKLTRKSQGLERWKEKVF